jgi:tripartite-type tricarboxylate transporter receptor subunit TctC
LTYGSSFVGSPGHVGAAMLEAATGTKMTHVPFKEMSQLFIGVANTMSLGRSEAPRRRGRCTAQPR